MQRLRKPYLLFLGSVRARDDAKTAFGLRDWCRDDCVGQWRLPGCAVDLGLPDLEPVDAALRGAKSLVIGVAASGGRLEPAWVPALQRALSAGLDLISGMHMRLNDDESLRDAAATAGRLMHDVRHGRVGISRIGTGERRSGKRLLTVGTDCALGKKYTALALTVALQRAGFNATFRATGQTGILIAGEGIAVDAVVADFVAGAVELLSPAGPAERWDVIEGQGSILHPSYAGVSLSLLHGSQPDAIVVCHDPTRHTLSGMSAFPVPQVEDVLELTLRLGRVTNPGIRCVGVSLNTSHLSGTDREAAYLEYERRTAVPAFDPMRGGIERVIEAIRVI